MKIPKFGFDKQTALIAGGALVVLYFVTRSPKKAGSDLGGAVADFAVGAVDGVVGGVVIGAGELVGIPRTNTEKCILAQKTANHLDASKYCNAVDFINWELFNKKVY